MPDASYIIGAICGAYDALVTIAPYVAMLIVASVLFIGILTRHVSVGIIFLAIVMALIITMFPTVLGALGVQINCS